MFRRKNILSPRAAKLVAELEKLDTKSTPATEEEINTLLDAMFEYTALLPQSGSFYGTYQDGSRDFKFFHRKD